MIVIDAGVAVDLLLGRLTTDRLHRQPFFAPHLIDNEVLHTLRRLTHSARISADAARVCVDSYAQLSITRFSTIGLYHRIWELRDNLSAYDATYVALTESLGAATLYTTDRRLAAAPGPRCHVELVA